MPKTKTEKCKFSGFFVSKYKEEYCESILPLFAKGWSIVEVATKHLMVTPKTYRKWKEDYPEFKEAAEFGESLAEAWYSERGRNGMITDEEIDNTLYIFTMKTRFRHRETDAPEHDGQQQPLEINFNINDARDDVKITRGE